MVDSAGLNPINDASSCHFITISGVPSPGAIPVDGIHGFERETGWDVKKGKGTQGATLTLKTFPPITGSVAFQLWLPEHFIQWTSFVEILRYNPAKKPTSSSSADALDIWHPSFDDIKLTKVVTHKISPWRHTGRGMYIATIDFIEWQEPPAVSVVSTTNTSKPDVKSDTPGSLPDPIGDQKDTTMGDLWFQGAKP